MNTILIRNNYVFGGGVENVLYNLVLYLVDRGYKITIVGDHCSKKRFYSSFPKCVKFYKSTLFENSGDRHSIKWLVTGCLNKMYRIIIYRRLLKKHFDVAVAIKEGNCMKELSVANADKKLAWVHVDYNYNHWTSCCFGSDEEERQCMQKYDKVVCVSQAACDSVKNSIGDPGNLCVLYNPLNVKRIKKLSESKDVIKKSEAKPVLVSVGRIDSQKNYQLLLDVCAQLQKKYSFEMYIIGDGPQRSELEKKITEQNISCVKLLGRQANPYPYIRQADMYVSSATWESYGLAIQEALILGVPVVAVSCPAIAEVFDTKYGLLVNNSFEGLYNGIEKMLTDTAFRKKCMDNIRDFYPIDELYEKRLEKICDLWE